MDAQRLFASTADARRLFASTADARRLFAPTADARRLFAPTAFPKKANCEEFVFRSTGEAPQKQGTNFLKTGSVVLHLI